MSVAPSYQYSTLWQAIGLALVLISFVVSLIPVPIKVSVSHFDKVLHLLTYAGLMFWFVQLYTWSDHWKLAIAFVAMGATIEGLQFFTGYRTADFADIVANTAGVVIGWSLFRTPLGRLLPLLDRGLGKCLKITGN